MNCLQLSIKTFSNSFWDAGGENLICIALFSPKLHTIIWEYVKWFVWPGQMLKLILVLQDFMIMTLSFSHFSNGVIKVLMFNRCWLCKVLCGPPLKTGSSRWILSFVEFAAVVLCYLHTVLLSFQQFLSFTFSFHPLFHQAMLYTIKNIKILFLKHQKNWAVKVTGSPWFDLFGSLTSHSFYPLLVLNTAEYSLCYRYAT